MLLLVILALGQPVGQPVSQPVSSHPHPPAPILPPPPARFGAVVTDWRAANGEALARERDGSAPASGTRFGRQARALGDRVGEVVAAGDCEGGERMAREAGDFALMRAVRTHCRSATR